LAGVKGISLLGLDRTAVTNAGLKHLSRSAALSELYVVGTRVTDAGVVELQQALPNCQIHR